MVANFLRRVDRVRARSKRQDQRTSRSVGVAPPYRFPVGQAPGAGAASVALARPDLTRRSVQAKLPGRFRSRERPPHIGRGRGNGASSPCLRVNPDKEGGLWRSRRRLSRLGRRIGVCLGLCAFMTLSGGRRLRVIRPGRRQRQHNSRSGRNFRLLARSCPSSTTAVGPESALSGSSAPPAMTASPRPNSIYRAAHQRLGVAEIG
jgi:hypothetical protein